MFKRTKEYLADYESQFMKLERHCRKQCRDWEDIIKELHIDRGSLLGSEQYEEMTGVERAEALLKVDRKITICHDSIDIIEGRRSNGVSVRRGFKHRCARIRKNVSALSDEGLGVKD